MCSKQTSEFLINHQTFFSVLTLSLSGIIFIYSAKIIYE